MCATATGSSSAFAAKIGVERMAHPLNYVRWSFDEGAGEIAGSVSSSPGDSEIHLGRSETPGAHWTEGRWGGALQLDGHPAVMAKLSRAVARGTRSVACWIRLPTEASVSGAPTFLAMPLGRSGQAWAEFSWNGMPGEGVLGALRLQTGHGAAVGTTVLRDGNWHHLAAIFSQPAKNANKPHAKLYVDGRLETFSLKSGARRGTTGSPRGLDGALWVGGRPGGITGSTLAVDELLLVDRPLAPTEIRHLMRTNQLLSSEVLAAN